LLAITMVGSVGGIEMSRRVVATESIHGTHVQFLRVLSSNFGDDVNLR